MRDSVPIVRIPDPHAGVQAARCDPVSVECNGIDLGEVALQCPEASSFLDAPYSGGGVVATRDNQISVVLETSDRGLMAYKHVLADAFLEIPYSERGIS